MREMKDSGIEWIGEIPKDWKVVPIKYVKEDSLNSFVDGPFGSNLKSCHYVDDGDVYVIESGLISTGKFIFKDLKTITFEHFSTIKRSECKNNDIIIAKIGANYGMAGILPVLDKPSVVSGNSLKLTLDANKLDNLIFIWQMEMSKKTGGFVSVVNETAQPALSLGILNNFRIVLPSQEEQKIIVDYLKEKLSEIDATAEDIQKEISLLEEYKKSVITEAVTKGLNPDAEMKDSGIEWIGEIPKDWDLLKIGYVTKEISDIDHYMPSDSDDIDKVPYLMIGDLKENISQIDFESCKYISKKVYRALSIKSKPEKENMIFARYATIGTVCFVDSEKQLLVSYACLTVKANELIKGRFLFYYFKSNAFLEEVSQYVKSNTQGNIGKESLIRAKIVVPKLKEQIQIISYLDTKCSEIDTLIADKKRQLDILADYKKSLIYEYVTGKKEVPVNDF